METKHRERHQNTQEPLILTVSPLWEGDNPKVVEAYLKAMLWQTLNYRIALFLAINECKMKDQSEFFQKMQGWAYHNRHIFSSCEAKYFHGRYDVPVWHPDRIEVEWRRFAQEKIRNFRILSHLWIVSGDNVPSPRALQMLIEDDKDVVGLPCFLRNSVMPYTNIQKWQGLQPYLHYSEMPKNQIVEVDGLSAACILLKRQVVEKIDFGFTWMDLDFSLCKSIREQGFKVYADTREICGHANPDGTILDEAYWIGR